MVPGDKCENNFSDATLYRFQGNLVHSSDVGWASLRDFPTNAPMECQKFSHFKAFKIKLLAIAYFGTTPETCLLYTSPSPRDATLSRMPSSA